jgi:hypothetical protein
MSEVRFELRKVAANDPRRTIGCVYEVDEYEVEVMWMRALPVAMRYMSPTEVLEDVRQLHDRGRSTRPITIPHLPPLLAT